MEESSCSDIYIAANGFNSLIVKLLLDIRVSVKIPQTEKKKGGNWSNLYQVGKKCLLDSWISSCKLLDCFCLGGFIQKTVKRGCLSTSKG